MLSREDAKAAAKVAGQTQDKRKTNARQTQDKRKPRPAPEDDSISLLDDDTPIDVAPPRRGTTFADFVAAAAAGEDALSEPADNPWRNNGHRSRARIAAEVEAEVPTGELAQWLARSRRALLRIAVARALDQILQIITWER